MQATEVFDLYWQFAAERQRVYFRRLAEPMGPWTNDTVLANHRFTNSYRASDRVSQYLIREVQYRSDRPGTPDELFFRTILFKIFNRIDTWEALEAKLGPLTWANADLDRINATLDALMRSGRRIYSAAYIMPSPPYGHARKHANHLALIARMMDQRLPQRLQQLPTLDAVYEALLRWSGIGRFLAFQYTIDLNYSVLLDHDEAGFVVAGPGALDGLAKCFEDLSGQSPEETIYWICDQQERAFAARRIDFQTLYGRRLQPIDCQNLLCEISKYARVSHPQFAGISGRTRIKQRFRATTTPIPVPMFPPKWGLDVTKADLNAPPLCMRKRNLFA
ncbi:nucleotide kinase domain-containing protein [Sphingosinicella sp. CPCC 101087]|uniref:nucleotide kinase domain-containing protein n=1 Tax=Sphingosinicella sp. CPCC 101087 TaxID=2497754 RepID=UPI00101D091C|nr:nucleotide kinase domain-containing protein [Sphingosinicella sp. CPCC 101087]